MSKEVKVLDVLLVKISCIGDFRYINTFLDIFGMWIYQIGYCPVDPLGAIMFVVPLLSYVFPFSIYKIIFSRENKHKKQQKGMIAPYIFNG